MPNDVGEQFALQYQQHIDMLRGLAHNLSRGRVSDVEDIVYASVLNVYEKTITGQYEVCSFKRLTAASIAHAISDEVSHEEVKHRNATRLRSSEAYQQLPTAQKIVESKESIELIEAALSRVLSYIEASPRKTTREKLLDRQVLLLLVREERPYASAGALARRLKVGRGVITQRMVRLKKALARELGQTPEWRAI